MEIKQVTSDDELNRVNEYLESKGMSKTNSLNIFYVEDPRTKTIIGCAGCEYIMNIEPFACDNSLVSADLYTKMVHDLQSGQSIVNPYKIEVFVTQRERFLKVQRLFERMGFNYISRVFRFVKQLNPKDYVH